MVKAPSDLVFEHSKEWGIHNSDFLVPGTASKVPLTLSRACMSPQSPTSQGRFPPVSGFSVDDDPEGHPPIDTAWLGPAAVENKQQTDDMASSLHRNES